MEIKKYRDWLLESVSHNIKESTTSARSLSKRINFPSGMHSAAKSNIKQVLDPALAEIQKFLVDHKGQVIQIELFASESKVPNYDREVQPKVKLDVGELSKKRYATIKNYMTNWLNGLKSAGTINQLPKFKESEPIVSGPEWTPPAGASQEQIQALAKSQQYLDAQYMEVRLSVVGTPVITPSQQQTLTNFKEAGASTARTSGSTFSQYNRALFYNYSYAPAAVLGLTKEKAEAMPGALLTMNREIVLKSGIKALNIKPFTITIKPNGGKTVKVVILNSSRDETNAQSIDDPTIGREHDAFVADSYNLEIPFAENTPDWKFAWQFAQWYIRTSFPNDWQFIANKPTNIDWNFIENTLNLKSDGTPALPGDSMTNQVKIWSQFPMDWYAAKVKSFYTKYKP